MNIYIPSTCISERTYIIDIILGEFLGTDYRIIVQESLLDYIIILENGNTLIIKDHFFKNFPNDANYLEAKYIPGKIRFIKNQFLVEVDIPIIYGDNELLVTHDKIICGIDIFASSFFMLTRWEEYVNKVRDKHDRFPAYASLAYKNEFLERPVVNEYVEMLWQMLLTLGIHNKRKTTKFKMFVTHDVDHIYRYRSWISGFGEIVGDFMSRKKPILGFKNLNSKIKHHIIPRVKNPYDTFDYLMHISEKNDTKSHFMFMSNGSSTTYDNRYSINDVNVKRIVNGILSRGHLIGLHSSYNSYNDVEQFLREKTEIERIARQSIVFGRQHYLRFEVPTTWEIWEESGMAWDSTLGYSDAPGFRCGTCFEYSIFNFLTRKKLNLKEKPLIAMDQHLRVSHSFMSPKTMESKIGMLFERCKRYGGNFMFLWHNSSLNTPYWKPYVGVYENIVKLSFQTD
jgi:hypothetical protein